jgi:septum formation topological specificity factor MinE
MDSSTHNSFTKLFKNREAQRQNEVREKLMLIAANQRAAVLVRMFDQGRTFEVQQLSAAG